MARHESERAKFSSGGASADTPKATDSGGSGGREGSSPPSLGPYRQTPALPERRETPPETSFTFATAFVLFFLFLVKVLSAEPPMTPCDGGLGGPHRTPAALGHH